MEERAKDYKERNIGEHPSLFQNMGHLSRVPETTTASLLSFTLKTTKCPKIL